MNCRKLQLGVGAAAARPATAPQAWQNFANALLRVPQLAQRYGIDVGSPENGFDFDQIAKFQPDLFICLVDNIEVVHDRLHKEHDVDATLKDCMVWREEEILATELMSKAVPGSQFAIMARGRHISTSTMAANTGKCWR